MIEFTAQGCHQLVAGPAGQLELVARLGNGSRNGAGRGIMVVCHPHPLYGGTMNNKVVTTLARAGRDADLDQIWFNYRGVGASAGTYGEMKGETEDLLAVVDLLREPLQRSRLILAGFSFGSGVASAAVLAGVPTARLALVAPPVSKYADAYSSSYPCPVSLFQGDADEVVEAGEVMAWAKKLNPPAKVHWFEGVSHFFHGHLGELHEAWSTDLAKDIADWAGSNVD